MVKWDKDYHERTGKWRPLKEYTKKLVNGKVKYKWDDPIYLGKQKRALENTHGNCTSCGDFIYSSPCIHRLPDGYQNDMRRRAYYKKIKEERNAAYLVQSQQQDINQ
jgi:hypothetical protein